MWFILCASFCRFKEIYFTEINHRHSHSCIYCLPLFLGVFVRCLPFFLFLFRIFHFRNKKEIYWHLCWEEKEQRNQDDHFYIFIASRFQCAENGFLLLLLLEEYLHTLKAICIRFGLATIYCSTHQKNNAKFNF